MEADALALVVVEASTLPNHETQVALAVPAAAVAMVVPRFWFCPETKLSRRGEPGEESQKRRESCRLRQMCELEPHTVVAGPSCLKDDVCSTTLL